jgi:hypothetical protein
MTTQRSFKRLVRARMAKTGESYSAARAMLLAGEQQPSSNGHAPALTMSDDAIRARTGRGWEELFALLDDWGATERTHTEIARRLREEHGIGGWDSQAVTVSYERARGMRAVQGAVRSVPRRRCPATLAPRRRTARAHRPAAPFDPVRLGRRLDAGQRVLRRQGRR